MAQVNNIKDLYENEDLSLREISRKTGHSFKTVQKYAYQFNWSEDNLPDTEPTSYPVLGDFIPVIDEWLEDDRKIGYSCAGNIHGSNKGIYAKSDQRGFRI